MSQEQLAEALDIRTDELLHNPIPDHDSAQQARCIADIARAAKQSFDANF